MFNQKLCKGKSLSKAEVYKANTKLGGQSSRSRYAVLPFTNKESLVLPTRIKLCTRQPMRQLHREKLQVKSRKHDYIQRNENLSFMNINSPSPTTYDPIPNPPNMTTPPAYTMRPKTYPEKDGGDRVAWGKEWFSNCDRWSVRVNFNSENKWPSPTDHVPKSTIGWPQVTLHQSPHSFSKRQEFDIVGKDVSTFPGPCAYDRCRSEKMTFTNSPSFSIQEGRRNGTLPFITQQNSSPGPGSYNPNIFKTSQKVQRPAFTISKSPRIIGITRNCTF